MSDDEEILLEGSDLYNYLIDQGYSDFKSFDLRCLQYKEQSGQIDTSRSYNQQFYHQTKYAKDAISDCDYNKVLSVLHCQLLFKEDIDILETILSTKSVYKSNVNLYSYASCAGVCGLVLSHLAFGKPRIAYYIPVAIVGSTLCTWSLFMKYVESRQCKIFASHISLLQNLCSNIHRIFRCIKETEIISTGQVSTHNIGVASYSQLPLGMSLHKSADLVRLPPWKTLPQMRRCLVDAIIVTINLLNEACKAVTNISMSLTTDNKIKESNAYQAFIKMIEGIVNNDQCSSLKNLQLLNDIYLAVQSEYLKSVALSLFHVANDSSISLKPINTNRKELYKIISHLQLKLDDISSNLISQYHIHNFSSSSTYTFIIKQNQNKNLQKLQIEVHNIYLLMLSVLLRVRSLEDLLVDTTDFEVQNKLKDEVNKQLISVRDDLKSAVKSYDAIFYRFQAEGKASHSEERIMEENYKHISEIKSKKTGIEVGVSDFSVNSPDEVFLAISNINNQEQDTFLDDWLVDNKPRIPETLLKELSHTLKSRKLDFIKREKIALKKKGQEDIEDSLESSTCEEIEYQTIQRVKDCTLNPECEANSSDSDIDEHSKNTISGVFTQYKKLHATTTSHSEEVFSDTENSNSAQFHINKINPHSIANLIAAKSQTWKRAEEENFSDG